MLGLPLIRQPVGGHIVKEQSSGWARPYIAILATIVLIRLLTLGIPDLVDTTEGRYATTAQLMLERDDWVTPWIIFKGVEEPYLGKPPLHFWLMDISYSILGLNNFSARLPSTFSFLLITATIFYFTSNVFGRKAATVASLVFLTSTLAFFLGGGCVLDVTLTVGVTLGIVGFMLADRSRFNGYLCFAGLGLGVLVKGPAAIVFFGAAVGPWAALQWWLTKKIPAQIRALPWFSGLALFLAVVTPWYILAEIRNPGFLKYFIWTENIGRFFVKEYGDKYGNGHVQPLGTAWLMMIPATVPWCVALLMQLFVNRRSVSVRATIETLKSDSWLMLAWAWTMSCPLLLMGAHQYTGTYIFTSMPGFAFLFATLWHRATKQEQRPQLLGPAVTAIVSALLVLTLVIVSGIFYFRITSAVGPIVGGLASLGLFFIAIRKIQVSDPLAPVGRIALLTALVYGGVIVATNEQVSEHRSTDNVLHYAVDFVQGDEVKIGFALNLPFSSRFYSARMNQPRVKVRQTEQHELLQPTDDIIIVRGKDSEKVLQQTNPNLKKLGELGRWRVYRGTDRLPLNDRTE